MPECSIWPGSYARSGSNCDNRVGCSSVRYIGAIDSCLVENDTRATQRMGRSRGGLTSKIHVVVDANSLPIPLTLTLSP